MDAVLLDLDGTLVDTEAFWAESQRLLTKQFSVKWTPVDELALVGHSPSRTADRLIAKGVTMTRGQVIEYRLAHVLNRLRQHIPWKPGVGQFLQDLRENEIPCALVTTSPRDMVDIILAALPPTQFAAVVTGSDCVHSKPHPEPYLRALALLGTSPERSIAVEDSIPGVESAANAGLLVVVVPGVVPVPNGPLRTKVNSLEEMSVSGLRDLLAEASTP